MLPYAGARIDGRLMALHTDSSQHPLHLLDLIDTVFGYHYCTGKREDQADKN